MRKYNVSCDGTVVGTAEIDISGLYCIIRCECRGVGGIVRLVDRRDDIDYSIGICVPMHGGIGIERKVPTKNMKGTRYEFLLLREDAPAECVYPLNSDLPIDVLKQIRQCRYRIQNQQPCLVVMSRQEGIRCRQSK